MISSTAKRVKSSIEVKLMTVKRKKKSTFMGGKGVTVAFSLCLLAVVAMIGMYTVGKSDQKQKELEQQVAEAEQKQAEEKAKQEEAQRVQEKELEREQEKEEERQEAASASAQRQKETEEKEESKETHIAYGAELESDFQSEQEEIAENIVIDEMEEAAVMEAMTEEPTLSFSPDMDKLLWPIAGNVILDYSMDKSVYFSTLNQYKYNPAVIIQGSQDASVMCAAQGKVTSIETLDETGTTVTMDIGDGYELVYGQLKELTVKEGDYRKAGETIGYVSEPTKYYAQEGYNVYFEVRKDGESVDPMLLLQ